jgi:hypothetical protein
MEYKQASEILTQAINYKEDGSTQNGNWLLSTDGVEAVKIAIEALKETPISDAMQTIRKELAADKSEGSWYYSWQSNIACILEQ